MTATPKTPEAFRTISELAAQLGVAQHILRYWETKFPQLKPLQRAGNRRYYRPADVAVATTIHRLLTTEGYSVRGVARVLEESVAETAVTRAPPAPPEPVLAPPIVLADRISLSDLRQVRDQLAAAIAD